MKFKQLTIHNIASIADATLRFDQKPLADESLFLICGETGSGKSTILDAICLALYKTTPRIKQSKSEKYVDESLQVIKNGENEGIQVSDPRQYLRRGTREGFISLSFTGNNGENCLAHIEFGIVGRSQNLKNTEWTLQVDRAFYNKEKDIRAQIVATVGFNFDQFCRTTMLAQGEFTRFLKSDEKEKSDILEKLTGTEIYSEIGKRIYEATKEKETAKQNADIALKAINLLDDEALQKLRDELVRLEKESAAQSALKNRLEKQKSWLERERELAEAEQNAVKEVAASEEKNREQQTLDARKTVAEWHRTEKERQAVAALHKLEQQSKSDKAENQVLESVFQRLTSGELHRKQEMENHRSEANRLKALLEKEQPFAQMYAESPLIVSKLQQHIKASDEARKLATQTKAEEAHLPQYEAEWKMGKDKVKTIGENLKKQEAEIKAKQERLDKMNPRQLHINLQQMNELLSQIKDAEIKLEARNKASQEAEAVLARVNETEKSVGEKTDKLTELNPQIAEIQRVFEAAKTLYDKTKLSVGDYAKTLRHELREGDVCPVCGNTVTTIEHDEAFEKALQPLQADFAEKEKLFNELKDRQKTIEAELKSMQQMLASAKKEQQQKDGFLQAAQKDLDLVCRKLAIDSKISDLEGQIVEMQAEKESEMVQLKQQLADADALQTEINALHQAKNKALALEKAANEAVTEAEKAFSEMKAKIQNYKSLSLQKSDDAQQALTEVTEKITYLDWQSNLPQTIARLKADAQRFNGWQETGKQLQEAIEKAEIAQKVSRNLCGQIMKLFPEWKPGNEAKAFVPLDEAWQKLFTDASHLRGRLTDNEKQRNENQKVIDQFLASQTAVGLPRLRELTLLSHEQINAIEGQLEAIDKSLQSAQGALAQVRQQRENHISGKPEMEAEATLDSLLEQLKSAENALTDLTRQMGDLNGQIKANESRREDYNRQKTAFEQAEKEWLKWDNLCRLFGDKEGKTFRVIAQSYVLRELLSHANTFLSNFSDRYELVCQNNLTILVRDLYFGGVARPVDLVSGGESFIVSLALALGLSSLNRNSLSADILFIDEGFGTLDPTVLEVVMNTLGKLQALGDRRVGVISHVEALRERIPVKILVEKVDNTTSRIRLEN